MGQLRVGYHFFEVGNGIPIHISKRGTIYTDRLTGTAYINKDNLSYWNVFTDDNITGGTNNPYIVSGSYSNGTTTLFNNSGGTIVITGYYTGSTDIFVTGGTYSNGTATFRNNTGGTFNVTGFTSTDINVSAVTFDTNNTLHVVKNNGVEYTALINNLSGLTVTGSVKNGLANTTTGLYSHAEGTGTTATGDYSHSEGSGTTSIGVGSHAEGVGTISDGDYQQVLGRYNATGFTNASMIIGNGTSNSNRSNLVLFFPTGVTFNQQLSAPTISATTYLGISLLTVTAKTGNYTVLPSQTNYYFTNEGAAGAISFTLPSASINLIYTFINQTGNQLDIIAGSGDTIRSGLNVSAAAGTISTFDIGSSITLVAINSTEWIATSSNGTWVF
jgi:hypothetical protein